MLLSLLLPSAKQEGHFIFELLITPLLLPLVKDCVDPFVGLSLEKVKKKKEQCNWNFG